MTRLVEAWRTMDSERRFAAIAALGLFVSMFLPWYQQNGVVKAGILASRNLDAFQVFSFVEAAVLLVAVALLYMLFARAEGRDFRLPGGDGNVVLIAGLWVGVLLIFRLFDKPGISSHGIAANVGVQWGIFFALAAAGLIAYSGSRMRGARVGPRLRPSGHRARPQRRSGEEDPSRGEGWGEEAEAVPPSRGPRASESAAGPPQPLRGPAEPDTDPTESVAARREAPTAATRVLPGGRPHAATPAGARRRPRYPPAPGEPEQLSFDDTPDGERE